jgi:hypothetical protein
MHPLVRLKLIKQKNDMDSTRAYHDSTTTHYTKSELYKLKELGRIFYIQDRLGLDEVSVKIGVPLHTVKKWAAAGGWERMQKNFIVLREEEAASLFEELAELRASIKEKPKGKRFPDAKEAAIRRQLGREIKDLQAAPLLRDVVYACKGVLEFTRKTDLRKAQELAPLMEQYVETLIA